MRCALSILICISALVFASCGTSVPEKEVVSVPKQDSVKDTITAPLEIIEPNPALDSLTSLFTKTEILPFAIEAKKVESLKQGKKLRRKQVNMLAENVLENDLFEGTYHAIKNFKIIDSAKAIGKYEEWKADLGQGQVMYSEAHCLSKLVLKEQTTILLWTINYSTEDACPFYYSNTVFATVIYKNKITETIVFAEQSGGGDAPISFDKRISGTINNNTVTLELNEENDGDNPKIEIIEGEYELTINEGKFTFTKEEKKKPRFVKRKTS